MSPVGSFRLGASRLDDRPPFGDLGFLVGAERLRGLLLARWNDKALVDKFLAHGRIVRCANGSGVELVDDVPRRALGGEQTRPQRELEPGEPRFLRRGDFRRDCDAVLGGDRKRLDPARARMCGIAVAVLEIVMSICPAIRSSTDGLTPR